MDLNSPTNTATPPSEAQRDALLGKCGEPKGFIGSSTDTRAGSAPEPDYDDLLDRLEYAQEMRLDGLLAWVVVKSEEGGVF